MAAAELSRSLKPRHLAMISIGGIIGAGLFVGSSASIAAVGPAIVVSYLITGTLVLLDDRGAGGGDRRRQHPARLGSAARECSSCWPSTVMRRRP